MKTFLVTISCSLLLALTANLAYGMAGELRYPSIALPADEPAELRTRVTSILSDERAQFLRGHFINAHTTLEYGGPTDALNRMLSELADCGGIQVKLTFTRTAEGAGWTLNHLGWGHARTL